MRYIALALAVTALVGCAATEQPNVKVADLPPTKFVVPVSAKVAAQNISDAAAKCDPGEMNDLRAMSGTYFVKHMRHGGLNPWSALDLTVAPVDNGATIDLGLGMNSWALVNQIKSWAVNGPVCPK